MPYNSITNLRINLSRILFLSPPVSVRGSRRLKRLLRLRRTRIVRGIATAPTALVRAKVVGVVEGRLLRAAPAPVTRIAGEHVVGALGRVGSAVAGSELLWLLVVIAVVAITVVVIGCAGVRIPRHDALIEALIFLSG